MPLILEGGIDQAEARVIRFPSGGDSVSVSVDAPCAVIPRCASVSLAFLSLGNVIIVIMVQHLNPNVVYMIMHCCIMWLLFDPHWFAHPRGHAFPLLSIRLES